MASLQDALSRSGMAFVDCEGKPRLFAQFTRLVPVLSIANEEIKIFEPNFNGDFDLVEARLAENWAYGPGLNWQSYNGKIQYAMPSNRSTNASVVTLTSTETNSPSHTDICILCMQRKQMTEEHIFPESIGGTVTFFKLCKQCNSYLGEKVDANLCNAWPIARARLHFGITGKQKTVRLHKRNVTLSSGDKVRMVPDIRTGEIEFYLEPRIIGRCLRNGGHAHHRAITWCLSFDGRPRCLGGSHRVGGTR